MRKRKARPPPPARQSAQRPHGNRAAISGRAERPVESGHRVAAGLHAARNSSLETDVVPVQRTAALWASARHANHEFSDLLSRVERGEEILITKRNKPVAVLSPYRPPLMTPEREKAVQHAIDVMVQGLPWGGTLRRFRREEMHER